MVIFHLLIPALWLVLAGYWGAAALRAKRTVSRQVGGDNALRLGIIVLTVLALRVPALHHSLLEGQRYETRSALMGAVGLALVALGIALAIWARVHLGRNWGMPMAQKETPELVTTGPYAIVRHPIYAGILLALLGSAVGESPFWGLPLILFSGYFVYSARREEKVMIELFPTQYPEYMKRTKMLLPFLL